MKRYYPIGLFALAACAPSEVARLPDTASESAQNHAQSCDANEPVGCYALAIVYDLGEETHQGVTQDTEHARTLYGMACNGGIPEACEALEDP